LSPGHSFLDLSGYIVSGKQAYSDLLREFKGFKIPEPEFEFELIRIQGGIRDLETALVDDWSAIRADSAIRRYRKVVSRFGTVNKLTNPKTWFKSVGWNYNQHFQGKFFELSEKFINKLVTASWNTNWPYPLVEECDHDLFTRKVAHKFHIKKAMDFEISLSAPDDFLEAVNEYLSDLLSTGVSENIDTIVTHNAFEPFNPSRALRYLPNSKCLIIDRDPRDSFVAMLPHRHLALSVDDFIQRYRIYHKMIQHDKDIPGKILRVRYEDLIFSYDQTIINVLNFLEVSPEAHVEPLKYFNPEKSIKFTQIWKKHQKKEEIEKIHLALNEWCDLRID